MTTSETHQLIEVDPATGEEEELIATGTMAKLSAMLKESLAELLANDEWDVHEVPWPTYRIEPVR